MLIAPAKPEKHCKETLVQLIRSVLGVCGAYRSRGCELRDGDVSNYFECTA